MTFDDALFLINRLGGNYSVKALDANDRMKSGDKVLVQRGTDHYHAWHGQPLTSDTPYYTRQMVYNPTCTTDPNDTQDPPKKYHTSADGEINLVYHWGCGQYRLQEWRNIRNENMATLKDANGDDFPLRNNPDVKEGDICRITSDAGWKFWGAITFGEDQSGNFNMKFQTQYYRKNDPDDDRERVDIKVEGVGSGHQPQAGELLTFDFFRPENPFAVIDDDDLLLAWDGTENRKVRGENFKLLFGVPEILSFTTPYTAKRSETWNACYETKNSSEVKLKSRYSISTVAKNGCVPWSTSMNDTNYVLTLVVKDSKGDDYASQSNTIIMTDAEPLKLEENTSGTYGMLVTGGKGLPWEPWYIESKNKAQHSTTVTAKFLCQSKGQLTYDGYYSSEGSFDHCRIFLNGSKIVNVSGFNDDGTWNRIDDTINVDVGDTFEIQYYKDSSVSHGHDGIVFPLIYITEDGAKEVEKLTGKAKWMKRYLGKVQANTSNWNNLECKYKFSYSPSGTYSEQYFVSKYKLDKTIEASFWPQTNDKVWLMINEDPESITEHTCIEHGHATNSGYNRFKLDPPGPTQFNAGDRMYVFDSDPR